MTDAGKLRGDGRGGENCLSPDVVRSLVEEARPNCRHAVSDQQLREAIETSRSWSSGADDFWIHSLVSQTRCALDFGPLKMTKRPLANLPTP